MMSRGIAQPHNPVSIKTEWLTPPKLLSTLGRFDLDPCSPIVRPWDTATLHYSVIDNGLVKPWHGRVFCNPPYDNVDAWLERCMLHGNAIALVFARTDTDAWKKYIWRSADAILFLWKRLTFFHADGSKAKHHCGAPSALIAYGQNNVESLEKSGLSGKVIRLQ